jgi:hypothetical protein
LVEVDPGAALDTTFAASPPRSLVSRLKANTPACSYAVAGHDFGGARYTATHLSFAIRYDEATFPGDGISMQGIGDGTSICDAVLSVGKGTLEV